MIETLFASDILQWIFNRISDLWQEPAGQIFITTTAAYLISYLTFSGYIARFSGGYGSISFSLVEFNVTDILTLVPTAFLTLLAVAIKGLREITASIFKNIILPIFIVFTIMFLINSFILLPQIPAQHVPLLMYSGVILWYIGVFGDLFSVDAKAFWFIIFFALKIVGTIPICLVFFQLLNHGIPTSLDPYVVPPFVPPLNSILSNIFAILFVFSVFLAPHVFGHEMAQIAVKRNILSKVQKIILKQPIPDLGQVEYSKVPNNEVKDKRKGLWISKAAFPIEIIPDIYICCPSNLYVVASFRSNSAFYLPNSTFDKPGTLIVVANSTIYSIELESRRMQDKQSKPLLKHLPKGKQGT